jgi:hypothetical protein
MPAHPDHRLDPDAKELAAQARRGFWLRHLTRWHWISSAVSLVCLILFTATGITLNHAADIEASPTTEAHSAILPPALLPALKTGAAEGAKAPLPPTIRDYVATTLHRRIPQSDAEWSADEVYLPLPRPGGDAWVSIDRTTGAIAYERTDRGWIAWLNDLHKGRNTGAAWRWFIDIFAAAALLFSITGLLLLQMHGRRRPITWPLVGFGLLLPVILIILFVH